MRATKLVICLIFGLLLAPYSSAQNYIEYLHNAQKQFTAGEYVNAKKSLTVYHEMIGYTKETGFASKIDLCIEYLHKAEEEKTSSFILPQLSMSLCNMKKISSYYFRYYLYPAPLLKVMERSCKKMKTDAQKKALNPLKS